MSEETTTLETEKSPAEIAEEQAQRLLDEMAARETRAIERAVDSLLERMQDDKSPKSRRDSEINPEDRPPVVPDSDSGRMRGTSERSVLPYGTTFDARDVLYRSFTAEQRKFRNPRLDFEMARWIRAVWQRDQRVIDEFSRRDADSMRGTALEGTPSTPVSGLSPASGGPFIPLPLHSSVIVARDKAAVFRSMCQVFTSEAKTLRVPTAGVATVAMAAEGATAAQGEPSASSVLLDKKKMQWYGKASEEILADSSFNLVNYFSERAGSAMGAYEDVQIATSNGTPPNITGSFGTPNLAITDVAEAVSGTLSYVDVVSLFFAVPKQYRAGLVWFADVTMMAGMSKILDADDRPIFQAITERPSAVGDSTPGQVGSVLGRPIFEVPTAAATLFAGDLNFYGLLDGPRMQMRVSDHVDFASDLVNFKITQRWDGAVLLADAFRRMAGITAWA